MFSSRFDRWNRSPNRLAALLAERRKRNLPVIDLTVSNPTAVGLEHDDREILDSLADPRVLSYEPSPAGRCEAREAVARYYGEHGRTVSPDSIILTASTSEGYAWLFKLLADPGDEFLVPRPSYPLFDFLAGMESMNVGYYRLRYHDGWEIDIESLESAVTERTRGVVLVNPNNPTGSYVKSKELDRLRGICGAKGIPIISDEVFIDYPLDSGDDGAGSLAGESSVPVFCLSGLSKVSALPQVKLGWIVSAGPDRFRRESSEGLEIIADTYLSCSAPAQVAAPRLLDLRRDVQNRITERIRGNLAYLQRCSEGGSAFSGLQVEGGWSAILQVPNVRTGEEWATALLDFDGVLMQPGYLYDFDQEAYLVVSLLTEPDLFREGISRLDAILP